MCNLSKILKVVETMYPDSVVSIGTKHQHSDKLTILLDGRHEFNPSEHRRDMVDCMFEFNLYVKNLQNGLYEAGSHNSKDLRTCTDIRPTTAITEMAYIICTSMS